MSKFTEYLEGTKIKSSNKLTIVQIEKLIETFSNLKITGRKKDEVIIKNKNSKNIFELNLDFKDNEFYFFVDGPSLKTHTSYSTTNEKLSEIKLKKYLKLANEINDLIYKKPGQSYSVKLFG